MSAELGSLTVEFTRLAQITGNNSYFDAVQRITNALELLQPKTNLPGMWPLNIDTSGCKMVQVPLQDAQEIAPSLDSLPQDGMGGQNIGGASDPIVHKHEKRQGTEQQIDWLAAAQGGHIKPEEDELKQQQESKFTVEAPAHLEAEQSIDWLAAAQSGHIRPEEDEPKQKPTFPVEAPVLTGEVQSGKIREEGEEALVHPGLTKQAQSGKIHKEGDGGKSDVINQQLATSATTTAVVRTTPSCVPRGLARSGFSDGDRFTLGGMADSLYEYLIKVGHLNTTVLHRYPFLPSIGIHTPWGCIRPIQKYV